VSSADEIRAADVAAVVEGLSSGELDTSQATALMTQSLWRQIQVRRPLHVVEGYE
jgi:hypothetical protein